MYRKHLKFRSICCVLLTFVLAFSLAACGERATLPEEDPADERAPYPFTNLLEEPEIIINPGPTPPDEELLAELQAAEAANSDTVGWLRVPNTDIDESVVHSGDNEFYLRRGVNKLYDWYGCYFADGENTFGTRDDLCRNTIIYGHSMNEDPDSLKFSQLKRFNDLEFATNNPYIYFATEEDDMVWEIFAVFYTDLGFNYIEVNPSDADFTAMINEAIKRSEMIYDVEVTANDKILTLSTCSYKFGTSRDQRYVVMARLVRPNEQLKETASVEVNPSPKLPNIPA